jgi:L-lactate dehydrogenase complex protein LldG
MACKDADMRDGRQSVLASIARALRRDGPDTATRDLLEQRLSQPKRNLIPARGQLAPEARIALFIEMASEAAATLVRLASSGAVPAAVADYLRRENLPPQIRIAPTPELESLPWSERPMLEVRGGPATGADPVSVTTAFAGIAETGTLMLVSGPSSPTTLNFLPDAHIVVLRAEQIVGAYEDGWTLLRQAAGGTMPRTVNFITGPSRSADIEQTLQLGAHGPRRLHILLIDAGKTT